MTEIIQFLSVIEIFLEEWNQIISLIGGVIGIGFSILISVLIFSAETKMIKRKNSQCFFAVLYEIRNQFSIFKFLSLNFIDDIENANKILNLENEQERSKQFLDLLRDIKKRYSFDWVSFPLHKYEMYEDVFDQEDDNGVIEVIYYNSSKFIYKYTKKQFSSLRIKTLVKIGNDCLENAVQIQYEIMGILSSLDNFFNETSNAQEILFSSQKTYSFDWKKIEEIVNNLKDPVCQYAVCFSSFQKAISNFCESEPIESKFFETTYRSNNFEQSSL